MSFNDKLSLCLSFQPNSVTAQGAGLLAGGFGASLRPSLAMLVAGSAGPNGCTTSFMSEAGRTGLGASIASMRLLGAIPMSGGIVPMSMVNAEAGPQANLKPIYQGTGMYTGGIQGVTLTGTNNNQHRELSWFSDKLFINKADSGKHYSRPDGLPHSPPKRRRRCEKEGGIAES